MARRSLFLEIILPVALVSIVCVGVIVRADLEQAQRERQIAETAKIQEKEKADIIQQVAARQTAKDVTSATTIDLAPWVNCSLTNSFVPKNIKNNNLEELPIGLHSFGGIPFDVTGRIQLWGRGLSSFGVKFPKHVDGIKVASKCRKIHLFHGALFVGQNGIPIARLVLHYDDGSQAAIEIITGDHVLDWWGSISKAGMPAGSATETATDSELAWEGGNPYIRAIKPNLAIRLYRTTFENPKPSASLTTIDYVSIETSAASFLLGLTVE